MSRRAGRRGYNSETANHISQEDDLVIDEEEDIVEEEEEEDEDEVTRCICGNDELTNDSINEELASFLKKQYKIEIDQGLFILCENCSVWQHGYCVGLFENNDVPDKYWCELCKPELHILVKYDGYSKRTLYKPVNDKRKKLEQMTFNETIESTQSKKKPKNERSLPPATNIHKEKRKERRHHHHHHIHGEEEDEYDEQLKRALRESARESGLKVSESEVKENSQASEVKAEPENQKVQEKEKSVDSVDSTKRRKLTETESHESKRPKIEKVEKSGTERSTDIESNVEEVEEVEGEKAKSTTPQIVKRKKRTPQPRSASSRAGSKKSREGSVENNPAPTLTKEELIQQPSKPRYVNDNSSIFELRKRTIAILEWLGRSQLELEEEKQQKLQLFSFIGDDPEDGKEEQHETAQNDALKLRSTFDENLKHMEQLTESILSWQDKFGKYAV